MLIAIGAMLVVIGVVMAAMTTARRGKLSEPEAHPPDSPPDTLEPSGRGRRLSLRAELPALLLIAAGLVLLLIAAMKGTGG